jgi:hypothetical protein
VKFYVYIADAKLDRVLAELLPADRERLAHELDLDVRLLEQAKTARGEPDATRFARAAAVGRHFELAGHASSLEGDGEYVVGQGPLQWGRVRLVRGSELVRHESESPVSFGCFTPGCELILTGSPSKLLAQPPAAKFDDANATLRGFPWFAQVRRLADFDDTDQHCVDRTFDGAPLPALENVAAPAELQTRSAESLAALRPSPWMQRLAELRREVRALPEGRLEFLARRLLTFSGGQVDPDAARFDPTPTVIIASPLYVAMTL